MRSVAFEIEIARGTNRNHPVISQLVEASELQNTTAAVLDAVGDSVSPVTHNQLDALQRSAQENISEIVVALAEDAAHQLVKCTQAKPGETTRELYENVVELSTQVRSYECAHEGFVPGTEDPTRLSQGLLQVQRGEIPVVQIIEEHLAHLQDNLLRVEAEDVHDSSQGTIDTFNAPQKAKNGYEVQQNTASFSHRFCKYTKIVVAVVFALVLFFVLLVGPIPERKTLLPKVSAGFYYREDSHAIAKKLRDACDMGVEFVVSEAIHMMRGKEDVDFLHIIIRYTANLSEDMHDNKFRAHVRTLLDQMNREISKIPAM